MTMEEFIAGRVLELGGRDVPADLLPVLKRNLIDSYAGICGSLLDHPLLEKSKRYATANQDKAGVVAWGTGVPAQLVHGVFLNTILGRRSDLVNTYLSPNHMGAHHPSDSISLLLTLGGWLNYSGADLMRAMRLVYMLSCAYSDYCDPESGGFDHDAAAGFYIALAAGHMLGLDINGLTQVQRIAYGMGLVGNQAGVGQITDWKHCTYASCALRGVSAALLARAGFEGPVDIYQGQAGMDRFFPHSQSFWSQEPDLTTIVFKRWQALVFCQTAIDVALKLYPAFKGIDSGQVGKIDLWTYKMALVQAGTPDSYKAASRAGRTHSLPYCVAAALSQGTINYDSFSDELAQTQAMQGLMTKVVLHEDEAMTAAYPAQAPCKIRISLADGNSQSARLDFPRGDPHDPLYDQEITDKAVLYLGNLVPASQAKAVVARIWEMEKQTGLDWMLAPLQKAVV